jgi:subtilisin family serine protease
VRHVGDDPARLDEKGYGNPLVAEDPHAMHGTHVAGIISAIRGNNRGVAGQCAWVRILPIRAVPDGDERDKDVANAIRYAVDCGARIINMSFGKGLSPHKAYVDEAVRYAAAHDVLLVHGAGNSGENTDTERFFPNQTALAPAAGGGEERFATGSRSGPVHRSGASSRRRSRTMVSATSTSSPPAPPSSRPRWAAIPRRRAAPAWRRRSSAGSRPWSGRSIPS